MSGGDESQWYGRGHGSHKGQGHRRHHHGGRGSSGRRGPDQGYAQQEEAGKSDVIQIAE